MPIPVYSASPINAATMAPGTTPQTACPEGAPKEQSAHTTASPGSHGASSGAQPAARPLIPGSTATSNSPSYNGIQPTPTQMIPDVGPPGPQPGAVPVPPVKSQLPPPPKAGEVYMPQQSSTVAMPMPPQMSYPAPTATYGSHMGSSTSTYASPNPVGAGPTSLIEANRGENMAHPPGYQQNPYASDFSSHQRAAYDASREQQGGVFGDEVGVWDTAKKWATAAGNSLAAAEEEVWKRINRD